MVKCGEIFPVTSLAHLISALPTPASTSHFSNAAIVKLHPKTPSLELEMPGKICKPFFQTQRGQI